MWLFVSEIHCDTINNAVNKLWSNMHLVFYCSIFYVIYKFYEYEIKRRTSGLLSLPGPLCLPFVGIMYMFIGKKNPLNVMDDMSRRFPIMKKPFKFMFGSYLMVAIATPDDVKTVLNSPNALKKAIVYTFIGKFLGNGLLSAPVEIWKRHRKTINPTFHQKILDTFIPLFEKHSIKLAKRLRPKMGQQEFNVIYEMTRCTLDMVCDTVMGVSLTNEKDDRPPYMLAVAKLMKTVNQRFYNLWLYPDFIYNLSGMYKKEMEEKQVARSFSNRVVKEKLKIFNKKNNEIILEDGKIHRKRFLDLLIELTQQDSEETKWASDELREEVDTLLVTGTETTATTNSFVLMMLGIYPDIQEKVVKELQEIFGNTKRSVNLEDLLKMQYLERVIKETLRIFPNGPILARETTDEIKLEQCSVPKDTTIIIFVRRLHLDKDLWGEDAHTFDPDRFLPERSMGRHPYAYIPFSAGPRNCIGFRYAMMAMKCLLTTIIRNYRIDCSYKLEDIKIKTSVTLKPSNGYNIKLFDRVHSF